MDVALGGGRWVNRAWLAVHGTVELCRGEAER
jgi:hypothetical protein